MIKAYIYNSDGRHSPPIYLTNNIENIAKFIARAFNTPSIQIVNSMDNILIETFGDIISYCSDDVLLNSLLPILIPMQELECDPWIGNINFYYHEDNYNQNKTKFIDWIYSYFNYKLGDKNDTY